MNGELLSSHKSTGKLDLEVLSAVAKCEVRKLIEIRIEKKIFGAVMYMYDVL